jgi:hypothetical protein
MRSVPWKEPFGHGCSTQEDNLTCPLNELPEAFARKSCYRRVPSSWRIVRGVVTLIDSWRTEGNLMP